MFLHNDTIYQSGPPVVTPTKLGQHYVDTDDGGDLYICLKNNLGNLAWANITNQP